MRRVKDQKDSTSYQQINKNEFDMINHNAILKRHKLQLNPKRTNSYLLNMYT